jgi:hypothetical protein
VRDAPAREFPHGGDEAILHRALKGAAIVGDDWRALKFDEVRPDERPNQPLDSFGRRA